MRRFLLATVSAWALLSATPAAADPISLTALALTAAAQATLSATYAFIASVAISVISGALSAAQAKKNQPKAPEIKRDLSFPNSRPAYRYVYGHTRMTGSPALKAWRVKGDFLFGCLIMNSRPSAGTNLKIFIDKREGEIVQGDILDFSGPGARLEAKDDDQRWGPLGVDYSYAAFWLGLGDQIGPPDEILAQLPDDLLETDAWKGRTVLWCRFDIGSDIEERPNRWPAAPPNVEVEMDWSLVWDPSDPEQDPDDETTWAYSANQTLCLLDALRRNPIRRYGLSQLHLPSFVEGADVADEAVVRHYAGGTEKRYETNGFLVWNGNELLDQVTPLAEAGAGEVVRIGSALGYAAGAWREPIYTMTDMLEESGLELTRLLPGRDLPRAIRAQYIAPDRDWQEAELPLTLVAGAETVVGDDGIAEPKLNFVTSPTQAQRIQKIRAQRAASQRRLRCTLPPSAIKLVAGANLQGALPAGFERLNHVWQVESINPGLWTGDQFPDGGVALRCPVSLREEKESHYAWDPAADEVEIVGEEFSATRPSVGMPGEISVTTGPTAALNGEPRIKFAFDPASVTVDDYEWQYRINDGPWTPGGILEGTPLDTDGKVFGYIFPVAVGATYDIRVRSRRGAGGLRKSSWRLAEDVNAAPPTAGLAPPFGGTATPSSTSIEVEFAAPNSADFRGMEIWGSDVDDVNTATLLHTAYGPQNVVFEFTESGLSLGVTRYYWARSIGSYYGERSDFTDPSVSATTAP